MSVRLRIILIGIMFFKLRLLLDASETYMFVRRVRLLVLACPEKSH